MALDETAKSAETFQHHPLENPKKQIRLLRFLPCEKVDDVPETELSTWPVGGTPDYRAISYTWGTDEMQEVKVNNQRFQVRTNCQYALRQVRARYPHGYVWLDSLCINQLDMEEKQHQVAMMMEIYVRASLVLVCLGPHKDDSEKVAAIASEMENAVKAAAHQQGEALTLLDRRELGPHYQLHWSRPFDTMSEDEGADLRQALIEFMSRSYWERLWIVQEIAAAGRNLEVLCGDSVISWLGVYLLLEITMLGYSSSPPSILWEDEEWGYRFRPADVADLWHERLQSLSVEAALDVCSHKMCGDPRDRIYGTLGLLDWAPNDDPIAPDYSRTPFQLVIVITAYHNKLAYVARALTILGVGSSANEMRDLRLRGLSAKRDGSQQRRLNWPCSGLEIPARTSDHAASCLALVASNSDLNNQHVPDSLDSLMKEHRQTTSQNLPKYLAIGPDVVGFVCHNAQAGDVLAHGNFPMVSQEGIFLVLRPHGNTFDVVGQGFLTDVFKYNWRKVARAASPAETPEEDAASTPEQDEARESEEDGASTEEEEENEEDLFMSLMVSMTAEDAVLFVGQDVIEDEPEYDSEARFERLFTNPVSDPRDVAVVCESKKI